jgi:hypothetical protein
MPILHAPQPKVSTRVRERLAAPEHSGSRRRRKRRRRMMGSSGGGGIVRIIVYWDFKLAVKLRP